MKNYFIGFLLIVFMVSSARGFAQPSCVTDPSSGDRNCSDVQNPHVNYVIPSATTLASRAQVQATVDQQSSLREQQQELNQEALQELIANQITNDPNLSAKQATITKSLKTT